MIGIVAGISFFVLTIAYVGQGNVRDTPLLRGEKVEQTIALEKINDELYVIGVSGIGGQNPTGKPNASPLSFNFGRETIS